MKTQNSKKVKLVVVSTVLINVIGFGIVIPVLPHYVESFGASPFTITMLFAVFAFCSFFSGPFLGSLSDKVGRRPMLLISIISTALGWLVFALAHNVFFLFLGRIIDGMAAGNISIAQNSLVDIAKNKEERTSNLGLIGAAFGIGFILGPLIGGLLSSFSQSTPFWFATVLAILNVIVAYFFLPETNTKLNKDARPSFNPFTPLIRGMKNRILVPSFLAWFLFVLAISSFQAIFALFIDRTFGLGPFAAGLIFTAMGVIIALNQVVALKHFWLKYFTEPNIEFWMILITGIAYFVLSIPILPVFLFAMVINAFGQSILRVVMTSQIVSHSAPEEQGEALGILSSIQSAGMIFGPLIAGAVFGMHPSLPLTLSGIFLLLAFVIIFFNRRKISPTTISSNIPIMSE